jgi:hypothetical protein
MFRIILILLIFLFNNPIAFAASKYLCADKTSKFFIMFNTYKYWSEANYIFWQSANGYIVNEYTFKSSYNKLSGQLKIKRHNLVSSENKWFNYECKKN